MKKYMIMMYIQLTYMLTEKNKGIKEYGENAKGI